MQTHSDAPGGRISFAAYRPKPGKAEELREIVRTHVEILRGQGLATDRIPIVVQSKDGTIVEVFEWASDEAIHQAHSNPAVMEMWQKFDAACEYVKLGDLPESQEIFATFVPG